jgi:O-antigen/teichoic acid export membrane protein
MAAQWIAGLGNLAFAVALARVLPSSEYSHMTAFLGVYVLLSVPGAALSAAGALNPSQLEALSTRIVTIATVIGVVAAASAVPIAAALDVETGLVVALGFAAPAAALLGARRGVAYGRRHHRQIAASLVAEPLVRLAAGVALAAKFGAAGGAAATAAAGYVAAITVTTRRRSDQPAPSAVEFRPRTASLARAMLPAAAPFALVAVLQTADLLVADRVLGREAAADFGVLSTIGGAAVFATATVPLVLLPALGRAASGRPADGGAARTATTITIAVGAAVAVVGALVARPFVELTFGERYADVAPLVGPYLVAMALIAATRVRLARLVADDRARFAVIAVAVAVSVQVGLIAMFARSPGAVVAVTLLVTSGLAAVLELSPRSRTSLEANGFAGAPTPMATRVLAWARHERGRLTGLAGLCTIAAAVRLATSRGLWVDEAISVEQAQMPFGDMLADMRFTDVHPPAHHVLLWITVRLFGTSELAVRLPSLMAGVALVPALYWVGRLVYDRRTGWVAAAMATVAPFCVWYSQEARMYSQFMLVAALAIGAQVQAVRRGLRRDWIVYGICTAALLWTQYFALLPIAVHQLAFAAIFWLRRRDRTERARLLRGWLVSTIVFVVAVAPMLPLLQDQLAAYTNRGGAGLVPGQAGAGNSSFGGAVSIYALGANLIWALLGYHADGVMVQLAALWPLLIVVTLVLLGRGRSRVSLLLAGLIVVPIAALFAIGSMKRDLFELRYFSGAVPALLLLSARFVTAATRRRVAASIAATALLTAMSVGLVDQQLNGANPRLYDFEGAFRRIEEVAGPDDVVLYEPSYLGDVVDYYAPGVDSRPVGSDVPNGVTVWVVSTDRIVNTEASAAALGGVLADLEQRRTLVDRFSVPNVRVWQMSPAGPSVKTLDKAFGR